MNEKYGIIDIGSNTIRLVIYKHERIGRFREIDNIKVVARLRNYLDDHQNLNERGIKVLLDTLIHFEEITNHHDVPIVKGVATATIRSANNQQEILKKVRENTTIDVRVLSEYEEAYYGFLSVVNSTSINEGITVDIGGGSTEVTYFKDRNLIDYHSFPFGALSLKKEFIKGDVPTESELAELFKFIKSEISKLDWLNNKKVPIIGIGGSARNMVQVDQGLKSYPIAGLHQYQMTAHDISYVYEFLTGLSYAELKKVEGLSEDRADIIIPAIQVFRMLCDTVDTSSFILSRKGLRDGVFYEQLMKTSEIMKFPNVLEESLNELTTEYNIDMDHYIQLTKVARILLNEIKEEGYASLTINDFIDLKRAAVVFYLGGYIDSEASSQHTFYVLANRTIDGLTHRERIKLALLASYKSKSVFKQYLSNFKDWFDKTEIRKMRLLGAVLKLAYALNYSKRSIVNEINMIADENGIVFEVFCNNSWQAEAYQAEKQKKHLAKAIKEEVSFSFKRMEF